MLAVELPIVPNQFGDELVVAEYAPGKYTFYDGKNICPGKMEGYVLPPNVEDYAWYPDAIHWMCIDCHDFYNSEAITELWIRNLN